MANDIVFTSEEMAIDEGLGYPKAYAKLCRDRSFGSFRCGPPFSFTPYALVKHEDLRSKELDDMFPIIDPKAKPTTKPKIFAGLLWKQLNHLGSAGFDPETFRVDPYGNVMYYHADVASPLAWNIDHWFPCSRGGLTVPCNLRILQWQVCKRKSNKLEFLIPWWDFQLGISINQFLSIFASSNSDFRHRAFSWLFYEGETEELNASQTVDSHSFPQHFLESKEKLGLAPAAIVLSRKESLDAPLKSLNINRRPRSSTPIIAAKKMKQYAKENEDPLMVSNPYQAIVMARDSLTQREETLKIQAEMRKLDNEIDEWQKKTEEEKVSIQDLELVLVKKRRRAEKCRRVAESQSSYMAMLEKMIRDAMHQSVVYKEQVRLNQAASSALMARLEAQNAICDSAERELHRKYKQRDELEQHIQPQWEQARNRLKINNTLNDDKMTLCLTGKEQKTQQETVNNVNFNKTIESQFTLHKELREFLEEEQATSEKLKSDMGRNKVVERESDYIIEERIENLEIQDIRKKYNIKFPFHYESEKEENEESRKLRGKGNIEKWMQILLENEEKEIVLENDKKVSRKVEEIEEIETTFENDLKVSRNVEDIDEIVDLKPVLKKINTSFKDPPYRIELDIIKTKEPISEEPRRISCGNENVRNETFGKERELKRPESFRGFRRIPSSPSLILEGMKKRVQCIRKKPLVLDDNDGDEEHVASSSFIKSSIKSIKKAVRI